MTQNSNLIDATTDTPLAQDLLPQTPLLRLIPLGGLGEIGKNMMLLEA